MTHAFTRTRIMIGVGSLLALALVAALAAAALSARAGQHDEPTLVPPEGELFVEGNEFPDDFRAEYRLKFGDPDETRPGAAQDAPPHQRGGRETFERLVNDGTQVIMGTLRFPAEENGEIGGVPWHTHPGPYVIAIAEGALTITWDMDCEPRTYEAGQAFVDLGENVHKAENHSDEETVIYFMGIGFPEGEPITNILVDDDDFVEPC
jgi:quercetin dioxygenase-like cupin family protein